MAIYCKLDGTGGYHVTWSKPENWQIEMTSPIRYAYITGQRNIKMRGQRRKLIEWRSKKRQTGSNRIRAIGLINISGVELWYLYIPNPQGQQ